MEVKPGDELSLTLPLVFDDDHGQSRGEQDDQEPKNHHLQPSTASLAKTCFNGLNALSGVGILSVPYALSSGGWLSLTLLFVIALVSFFSALLIKRCLEFDPRITTYPDIGFFAFGKIGRNVVSVLMYTELYLVATGFLILEGDNLSNLFPGFGLEIAGFIIHGKHWFVLIIAVIILPSVLLDNLSLLSYVSAGGVLSSAIILGSIVWTGAFDGIGFHHQDDDQDGKLIDWSGIPTAVSLYAFCYCAHPMFPTLYTSMKNKNQFSTVLLICFTICTIVYASMAVFGYLMFGPEVESQITLNLPTAKLSSRVAIYTALISPIAKYALMVTPIVEAFKCSLPSHLRTRFFGMIFGTTILISSVIVALIIPFFASLMALVGAFLSITASIILPCLCYLKISGTYQRFGSEMVSLVGIIVIGFGIAVLGTYTSVVKIIANLQL